MLSANGSKIDVVGNIGDVLTETSLLLYQVCLSVAELRMEKMEHADLDEEFAKVLALVTECAIDTYVDEKADSKVDG